MMRKAIFQSAFLTGIPVLGFALFSKTADLKEFAIFISASFLCAISVSFLNLFFESRRKIFLACSLISIATSLILSGLKAGLSFNSFFIFITYCIWVFYYLARRGIEFADIPLHFFGGFLIFWLGALWNNNEIQKIINLLSEKKLILSSLFISFAFQGGYIIDLIQDIEEDRKSGQKNIVEKIGKRRAIFISQILFTLSYLCAMNLAKNVEIKMLMSVFMIAQNFIVLVKRESIEKEDGLKKYRAFYRAVFSVASALILASHQTDFFLKFLRQV
ncbi:1,4-dihydroxy-2-naphthoate octaprenyltransferase [bacterium HR19]|nr:1,4-dihydroxy-2-naphthoate octaprenyltransferase [bacterium HR19]